MGNGLLLDNSSAVTTENWSTGCWRFIPDCIDGLTVAIWIKFLAEPVYKVPCVACGIISSFQHNKASGFSLTSWNCSPGFKHISLAILDPYDGKYLYTATPLPTLNTWTHYVFTLDYVTSGNPMSMFKMYQNGVIVVSPLSNHYSVWDKPASIEIRDTLIFGNGFVDYDADHPNVVIDNVLMFNYSLNIAQVDKLYHM